MRRRIVNSDVTLINDQVTRSLEIIRRKIKVGRTQIQDCQMTPNTS